MIAQRLVLTIFSTATLMFHSVAAAQTTPLATTIVRVGFHPEQNAFEIEATSGFVNTITAPDGTVFRTRPGDVVGGLSESGLLNRFAGNWSIRDPLTGWQYRFSVTGEQLAATLPVPEIISPADGARLPAIFEIQHTGDGHALAGVTAGGKESFINYAFNRQVNESRRQPGSFPISATDWAFNYNRVILGPATPIGDAVRSDIVAVVNMSFSTPRNWTIGVPEPTSMLMASSGLLGLAALRRRK
ncbi:PEP-CTERM sorting domain-containing protein [Lacipirellula sp.]|uniref:PEP-CTERM sorting domain-containing protein n=1 Tax=Lacipirellula sp. TaxID=2691419 RepID=UPI003D0F1C60